MCWSWQSFFFPMFLAPDIDAPGSSDWPCSESIGTLLATSVLNPFRNASDALGRKPIALGPNFRTRWCIIAGSEVAAEASGTTQIRLGDILIGRRTA